jgi:hypothetical protein
MNHRRTSLTTDRGLILTFRLSCSQRESRICFTSLSLVMRIHMRCIKYKIFIAIYQGYAGTVQYAIWAEQFDVRYESSYNNR